MTIPALNLPSSPAPAEVYTEPTLLQVVLIYVGIPLLVTAIIVVLVMAPSWTRRGRYRPGMDWDNDPLWIGTETAIAPTRTGSGTTAPGTPGESTGTTETPEAGGGSSARW
jgi:hypothetical protein